MTERALTVRDVAQTYGVTPQRVYGWIKDGHIRPIRLPGGGPYRFRRSDLEEFETRCRDASSTAQTTDSGSEETAGTSNIEDNGVVQFSPFERGRRSVNRKHLK